MRPGGPGGPGGPGFGPGLGPGFGGPGGPGFGPPPGPGFWGPGPFWGPPPFLWSFWCGPPACRCPGLPLLIFLITWGVLYGIFAAVYASECGAASDPDCGASYGIAAGAIFFFLLVLYLCGMFISFSYPPPHHPHEAEGLLGHKAPPSPPVATAAAPTATVTVEKV